jgi:integrase
VRRSLSKDDDGRLVIKATKTERGRTIALLPQVVEALRAHRKRQAEERLKYSGLWRDEDLVFPSTTGSTMSWNNLVGRNLKPLMRAAGLPQGTRPYDLRHTFATLMLEQGENPKVVQEVLGHSHITHTMDTYSHVSPNIQKEAFGRLGKRLGGLKKALKPPIAVRLRSNSILGCVAWARRKKKSPAFADISSARSAGLEPATF